jgi:DNA-binding MarR family transcriptional regulator
MTDINTKSLLRLFQASHAVEAKASGAISSVHGLALKEAFLLMHLENAPLHRLPRVELARRLHVSASTVTRMTAPLEKIGLVGRKSDDRDARLSFVVLTEAGKTRISETRTTLNQQAARIFQDRWSKSELKQLSDLLARLLASENGELA